MERNIFARSSSRLTTLSRSNPGFFLKQHTNECCRCGPCQPNIDWLVQPYLNYSTSPVDLTYDAPTILFVKEDAPYFGRCMSWAGPGFRRTTYNVHLGGAPVDKNQPPAGQIVMRHEKGWSCGKDCIVGCNNDGQLVYAPMCCCLPYLDTYDSLSNQKLGTSAVECVLCLWVPQFSIADAQGVKKYRIKPATCCCGCCIDFCKIKSKTGVGCCRIPYLIRDWVTDEPLGGPLGEEGINDLWLGLTKECCLQKNLYACKYPHVFTEAEKATMIGCTLLYDITLIEQGAK